jgi:hypothetical protein
VPASRVRSLCLKIGHIGHIGHFPSNFFFFLLFPRPDFLFAGHECKNRALERSRRGIRRRARHDEHEYTCRSRCGTPTPTPHPAPRSGIGAFGSSDGRQPAVMHASGCYAVSIASTIGRAFMPYRLSSTASTKRNPAAPLPDFPGGPGPLSLVCSAAEVDDLDPVVLAASGPRSG